MSSKEASLMNSRYSAAHPSISKQHVEASYCLH